MHNADNEVTQEDLAAVDTIGGHMASYYEFGQSDEYAAAREAARDFRLASIEATCRDKDAKIAKVRATWARSLSRVVKERDQLRAKLDEANEIIADLLDIKHGDEKEKARAFLASAPQPLISKDQAIKLAEMEGDAEIGAGMPDHPLRQPEPCNWVQPDGTLEHADKPEQKAQGDGAEPVAWAPTSFRGEGYVYRRKEDAETRTGPATPLYAHPPAPVEAGTEGGGWLPIESAPLDEDGDSEPMLLLSNGKVVHGWKFEGLWINFFCDVMEPQPTMWHGDPTPPASEEG